MFRHRNQNRPRPGEPGYEGWRRSRNMLRIRRTIGVLVMLGMAWGIVWVVMFSGLTDPIVDRAGPAIAFVHKVWNDPAGAMTIVASVLITHIGLIMYIFDDRNY